MKKSRTFMYVLWLACGLVMGGSTYAAEEGDPAEEGDGETSFMEEIVVTATKREENVLEVPVPVTAFNSDLIEQLGITNTDDLEQMTPGLQFGTAGGQGTTIRGVSSRLWASTHADQAVAYYVDGVYSYTLEGVAPHMFDMDRVEVARGPQGTVHGRNSIAGAISFFPKRPGDEWEADVLVEATDQTTQRVNVAFGGPLSIPFVDFDGLSFRITAGKEGGDGAFQNIGLGPDAQKPDESFVFSQLRFKTERIDVNVRYSEHEDTGVDRPEIRLVRPNPDAYYYEFPVLFATQSRTPYEPSPWYLDREPLPASSLCGNELPNDCDELQLMLNTNAPTFNDDMRRALTVHASFDITDQLTMIYTYGDSKAQSGGASDLDGMNATGGWDGDLWWVEQYGIFRDDRRTLNSATGVTVRDERSRNTYIVDQSSHELTFRSNFDGPFNFVTGLFYYENETGSRGFIDRYTAVERFQDTAEGWDQVRLALFPPQRWGVFPLYEEYMRNTHGYDPETAEFGVDGGLGIAPGTEEECNVYAEMGGQQFWGPIARSPNFFIACDYSEDRLASTGWTSRASSDTKAAFFHADYEFDNNLTLSGGVRYTRDTKREHEQGWFRISPFSAVIVKSGDDDASPDRPEWSKWIWDLSLEYDRGDNVMYYGRVSTGYRAGSFATYNATEGEIEEPRVGEETLINYEIGVKGRFLDRRLTLTSSAFYSKYDDMQITLEQNYPPGAEIPPTERSPLLEFTDNIPTSTLYGAEAEFTYIPNERWRFSGYYVYFNSSLGRHQSVTRGHPNPTYLERDYLILLTGDTTYNANIDGPAWVLDHWAEDGSGVPFLVNGEPVPCNRDQPVCFATSLYQAMDDKTGNEMPKQPRHKAAVTASYSHPLEIRGRALGNVSLLTSYSYTGARHPYIANLKAHEMRGYGRWDARLSWESVSGDWSAALWVQNMMDDVGLIEWIPLAGSLTYWGNPDGGRGMLTDARRVGFWLRWKM